MSVAGPLYADFVEKLVNTRLKPIPPQRYFVMGILCESVVRSVPL